MRELTELKDIAYFCKSALHSAVESLAKFAKKLNEFRSLDINDQVSLLKHAGFEISMIAISSRYVADGLWFPSDGVYFRKQILERLDLMFFEDKFRFFDKMKNLNLTDRELALFCVLALAAPGRYTGFPSSTMKFHDFSMPNQNKNDKKNLLGWYAFLTF